MTNKYENVKYLGLKVPRNKIKVIFNIYINKAVKNA